MSTLNTVVKSQSDVKYLDCRTCGQDLPSSEFYAEKSKRGFRRDCKQCHVDRINHQNHARKADAVRMSVEAKYERAQQHWGDKRRCPACRVEVPVNAEGWTFNDSLAGGLSSSCRNCEYNAAAQARAAARNLPAGYIHLFEVYDRAAGCCHICSEPVQRMTEDGNRGFDIDHLVPFGAKPEHLADLGVYDHPGHSFENVSIAHKACNARKWAKVTAEDVALFWEQSATAVAA